jgi:hypothetical protein
MSDFIAAACVGVGQVAIGHPFDTTKILIQNNRKWSGLPLRSYYKGWRFPLCSAVILNCITFPTVERTKSFTQNSFASGCIAGLAISPIVFCFDIGKIKRQTNQPMSINTILHNRGRGSTLTRETLAASIYFGTYFTCKDFGLNPLIAGGIAGLCNWTVTYPIDVIKSRQIAQNITIIEALRLGSLYKGFHICAFRAVLVNSVNFWIYENVKQYF